MIIDFSSLNEIPIDLPRVKISGGKMRLIFLGIVASIVVGCASSGPIPIGRDTYMITKQSAGGIFTPAANIKVTIIREAAEFCASNNKAFQIVNTEQTDAGPGRMPSAEISFMCLDNQDRDYRRTNLQKTPNTVIEVRH